MQISIVLEQISGRKTLPCDNLISTDIHVTLVLNKDSFVSLQVCVWNDILWSFFSI